MSQWLCKSSAGSRALDFTPAQWMASWAEGPGVQSALSSAATVYRLMARSTGDCSPLWAWRNRRDDNRSLLVWKRSSPRPLQRITSWRKLERPFQRTRVLFVPIRLGALALPKFFVRQLRRNNNALAQPLSYSSWRRHLAGLPDKVLVCTDGQGRAREVGLARHEHVFDATGTAAAVRSQACPGDVRGAGRLLAAADRDDLGVARGSGGIEELRRVGLDDTSPVGGQVELVDHEPGLLAGGAGPMIPHVHRRQVSHDEDPVPVEVGAAVKPLGGGLLLGRDVGETVIDPRHRAADRGVRLQAGQRLRWQRFDIQCAAVFIDGGDDVAGRRRLGRGGDGEQLGLRCEPLFR